MNRRNFLQNLSAMFAGAFVIGETADAKIIDTFDDKSTYTGKGFNIWIVQDRRWNLFSDSMKAPYEFGTEEKTHDYARMMLGENPKEIYRNGLGNPYLDKNGKPILVDVYYNYDRICPENYWKVCRAPDTV